MIYLFTAVAAPVQAAPVSISWDWLAPFLIVCLVGALVYYYREAKKVRAEAAQNAVASVARSLEKLGETLGGRIDQLGTDFRETVEKIFERVNLQGEEIRVGHIRCEERTADNNRRFCALHDQLQALERKNDSQHQDLVRKIEQRG